jgi:hypothetical protein
VIFWFIVAWLLLVLAAARMTNALVYEKVFKPMRDWLAAKTRQPWRFLASMLECHWCTGFWVTGIMLVPVAVAAAVVAVAPLWLIILAFPYLWASAAYGTGFIIDHEG